MTDPAASAPAAGPSSITAVVFDLGGVLIDWDPRYLYRQLLPTDEEIAEFLEEVGFERWNHEVDAGQISWAGAADAIAATHPHRRDLIEAYPARFAETMSGAIEDSVELLQELHDLPDDRRVRLVALTNWSADTFAVARARFGFLDLFEGIVVSGEEGVAKPDPEIFEVLVRRHGLDPSRTLFVDDKPVNIEAAETAGLAGLLFTDAAALRDDLQSAGVLPESSASEPSRDRPGTDG